MINLSDCGKMAELEQKLLQESERGGRTLLRYLRAEKSGKRRDENLVPYLLQEAEEPLLKMIAAEERLKELDSDAEEFCKMLGDYPNIRAMAEVLNRERNKIDRSAKDARICYEQALRNHRDMDQNQVQQLDVVREARLKADRIKAGTEPKVADLESRLRKCHEILKKYN